MSIGILLELLTLRTVGSLYISFFASFFASFVLGGLLGSYERHDTPRALHYFGILSLMLIWEDFWDRLGKLMLLAWHWHGMNATSLQ